MSTSSLAETKVALEGRRAIEWLERQGLELKDRRGPRLFADRKSFQGLSVARIWHTAATLVDHRGRDASTRIHVVVDGESTISVGSLSIAASQRGGVSAQSAEPIILSNAMPVARYEVILDGAPIAPIEAGVGSAIIQTSKHVDVLLALLNEILDPSFDVETDGSLDMRACLEFAVRAATRPRGANRAAVHHSKAERALFERALAEIETNAWVSGFTVGHLTRRLNISPQYLRRVMATAGTTASREIQRVRAGISGASVVQSRNHRDS